MPQHPPEPDANSDSEGPVDTDRPLGPSVARHRIEADPADDAPWNEKRMRAATPRELRRDPEDARHAEHPE